MFFIWLGLPKSKNYCLLQVGFLKKKFDLDNELLLNECLNRHTEDREGNKIQSLIKVEMKKFFQDLDIN